MKKILFLLFFVPILFSSCEKDDEPNQTYTSNTNNNNNNSASWDCTPAIGCYDPGTGNGQYASLGDCETDCGGVTLSFDCIGGSCIDPGTGNGTYSTFAACASNCGSGNDIDPQDLIGEWNIDDFIVDGNSLFSPNNPMSDDYIISMQFLFQNTGQVIVTQLRSDDPSANVFYDQWSVSSIGSVNMLDIVHADGSEEHWTIVELTDTYMELTFDYGITAVIYASKL